MKNFTIFIQSIQEIDIEPKVAVFMLFLIERKH